MRTARQQLYDGGEIIAPESKARPGRIGFLVAVLTMEAIEKGPGKQNVKIN
jgi:hypothetical protein